MLLIDQKTYPTTTLEAVSIIETIDHLRAISLLSEEEWLDLLQLNWSEYQSYRSAKSQLKDKSILGLSSYFNVNPLNIINGNLNFKKLELQISNYRPKISEEYMVAAYSRRRTTITTMEFLENTYGWRLQNDVMKTFGINQAALLDPFSQISLRLLTEICTYLKQRKFDGKDFFLMGVHSAKGNHNSILGKTLSQFSDIHDVYYHYINDLMSLFECNFKYTYYKLGPYEGLIEMKSNLDIASELGVNFLGNSSLCQLKCGIAASLPNYIGLPVAQVWHPTCEHMGDDSCKFFIDLRPSLIKAN